MNIAWYETGRAGDLFSDIMDSFLEGEVTTTNATAMFGVLGLTSSEIKNAFEEYTSMHKLAKKHGLL